MSDKLKNTIVLGNKRLFPMNWAYNDKQYIIKENFSDSIIKFLPSLKEFKDFCSQTKISRNNIYLCTDPYNLFVFYDSKYIYIPLPILSAKVITHLKINEMINNTSSIFKKYINRGNYVKIYSYINVDIRSSIFKLKYFDIPEKQRFKIFSDILNSSGQSVDEFDNDILDDVFRCMNKYHSRKITGQDTLVKCYSVYNQETASHNSSWIDYDSALTYANTILKDASIYSSLIKSENILGIVSNRIFAYNDNVIYEESITDIIKDITNGEILRRGYKILSSELISDFRDSISSLQNFYRDNIFSASHTLKILELGTYQGMYMRLSRSDLRLLLFCLCFTGVCLHDDSDTIMNPSQFLDYSCLINMLPEADSKFARYIIDSYCSGRLSDVNFISSYNISNKERASYIRDIYLDILNLSFNKYNLFVEENLKIRDSRRFIGLWKSI